MIPATLYHIRAAARMVTTRRALHGQAPVFSVGQGVEADCIHDKLNGLMSPVLVLPERSFLFLCRVYTGGHLTNSFFPLHFSGRGLDNIF